MQSRHCFAAAPPAAARRSARSVLHDFLTQAAHRSPGVQAIRAGEATLTYGQLGHDAAAVAHSLRASGVQAGDRVIVFSPHAHGGGRLLGRDDVRGRGGDDQSANACA